MAILALLKLAAIADRQDFKAAAEKGLRLFAERLQQLPQAACGLLLALDFSLEEPQRVVIAGDAGSAEGKRLIHAAQAVYQPNKVVLGTTGPVEPFARTLPAKDGKATVYLCTGTTCQAPTHDPDKVKELLQ